ncbi:putative transcriptional regulator, Crp/Fnr family [Leptospira ryugenii]|uniref:Putative transcriptional regulator, Crp/Fnr family n=1 Tax=Leptospira ryugenii TaxID=1917863 RepID=A0A2P2E0L3_9LEPT|nr:Crp/Fnr family transcriptional regulator [Leptospira ryugenii]GBF50435.1 putative transcriptional regulator, Crp/Fnr family [Leptospira ryugenii]
MFDKLKQRFEREVRLSEKDWSILVQHVRYIELQKNQILLRPGEIANYGIFLMEGILRICNHHEGREYTRNIFTEGDFFTESGSFFSNQSFGFQIDALEDTKVFLLPKASIQLLENQSVEFSTFFRKQMERALVFLTKKVLENQKTALERFLEFRKQRPSLLGRVPQYVLASFLNITPEAYSRIQKQAIELDLDQEKDPKP